MVTACPGPCDGGSGTCEDGRKWVKVLNKHFSPEDVPVAAKDRQRCPRPLSVGEMPTKATARRSPRTVRRTTVARTRRTGEPWHWWEMRIGTAAVANSPEGPENIQSRPTMWPSHPPLGIDPKPLKPGSQIYPHAHGATHHSQEVDTAPALGGRGGRFLCICDRTSFSRKQKEDPPPCSTMDGPGWSVK